MDPRLVEYIGFVVAALILGWAVAELNRRYFRQRKEDHLDPLSTWVKLDSAHADNAEESLLGEGTAEDQEETPERSLHTRAQQNGHHSESKKIL
jgi:hypothetical protein